MVRYKITFKPSVAKDLKGLPKKDVQRIINRIDELALHPRGPGCKKMSAQERYKTRQGVYRILYEIKDKELVIPVVKVGHRSAVYKH